MPPDVEPPIGDPPATDDRPLPTITEIWADRYRTQIWHQLWIEHLRLQGVDEGALSAYLSVAERYVNDLTFALIVSKRTIGHERLVRHEVVAALDVFNDLAGHTLAHHGLASSDIVDVANQQRIIDSLAVIFDHALRVAERLRQQMVAHAQVKLVARTHGQPAELTTYGHRIATLLSPLMDWIDRTAEMLVSYLVRPPYGAVGTAADLGRVVNRNLGALAEHYSLDEAARGWGPIEQYASHLAHRLGFMHVMDATRQVYHRSHDLQVASQIAALASLAQTWANDRRLESMLGLGGEEIDRHQSASSSMPQKANPRYTERISALSVVARSHLLAMSEMAGMEWLEGDVSTSAARRLILPAMFSNADIILANWHYAAGIWAPDLDAIRLEVREHSYRWATAAVMDLLIRAGLDRPRAHEMLREAWAKVKTAPGGKASWVNSQFETVLIGMLLDRGIKLPGAEINGARPLLQRLVEEAIDGPVGNVADQIDYLDRRVTTAQAMLAPHVSWPEVRP